MRYYSKPNLKAPRFRRKRYNVISNDFIKRLKNKYPKSKNLKIADIRNIIGEFNEFMWNTVINTRDGVELPNNMGSIFIGSCQRPTKFNIDKSKHISSILKKEKYKFLIAKSNIIPDDYNEFKLD